MMARQAIVERLLKGQTESTPHPGPLLERGGEGETPSTCTIKEAAARLDVSCRHAAELMECGELRGYDVSTPGTERKRWRVYLPSIEEFKRVRSNMVIPVGK